MLDAFALDPFLRADARIRLLDGIAAGHQLARRLFLLTTTAVVCGAVYGAVLGSWRSPRLALYVAIKLPLLFLITALLTSVFNWIAAKSLGLHLRYPQVLALTSFVLATASIVLVSVAPIAWFMTTALPGPSEAARTVHNLLYLTHTFLVGGAGLVGMRLLWSTLQRLAARPAIASNVFAVWVASFALVGGEVAWILRPFVGSVYFPVQFLRADALRGNVYEFIFTDILPHLIR